MRDSTIRIRTQRALLVTALLLCAASLVGAANDFKLKPGARGKLCVDCHDGFEEVLAQPFVHTPITEGECSACHSPHTSNHEMLLSAQTGEMCLECHDDLVPEETQSAHEVFVDGKCILCHDPHSSENENILRATGSALCFDCHEEMGERVAENDEEHEPVTEDCLECHNPHVSAESTHLLSDSEPGLCLDCHETDDASFAKQHNDYPVTKARCTACHDPHGSNTEGILYDNVHEPVVEKKCDECHEGTGSSPFALKETGFELCEGCHYEEVIDHLNKDRVHWPLLDKTGCLNCHAPHASPQESLLKAPMLDLCSSCHADTVARQERAQTEHPPMAEGACTECHSPHSSDNLFLLNEASSLDLCENCHEWQTHSTHPIGDKIVDPRNQNVTLECFSCHRSHGTEYEHFLYYETTNDLCIQCHQELRR